MTVRFELRFLADGLDSIHHISLGVVRDTLVSPTSMSERYCLVQFIRVIDARPALVRRTSTGAPEIGSLTITFLS